MKLWCDFCTSGIYVGYATAEAFNQRHSTQNAGSSRPTIDKLAVVNCHPKNTTHEDKQILEVIMNHFRPKGNLHCILISARGKRENKFNWAPKRKLRILSGEWRKSAMAIFCVFQKAVIRASKHDRLCRKSVNAKCRRVVAKRQSSSLLTLQSTRPGRSLGWTSAWRARWNTRCTSQRRIKNPQIKKMPTAGLDDERPTYIGRHLMKLPNRTKLNTLLSQRSHAGARSSPTLKQH